MKVDAAKVERLKSRVNRHRLLDTAQRLIEVPSPTGEAGRSVIAWRRSSRPMDSWSSGRRRDIPESPAVVVRLESGSPGPNAPV